MLADLVNERWVLQPALGVIRPLIDAAFRAHGLGLPREKVNTFSMHVRNHLIATGRYLTILPGSALHFNLKRLSLKALPEQLLGRVFHDLGCLGSRLWSGADRRSAPPMHLGLRRGSESCDLYVTMNGRDDWHDLE
jgi:DNA-binding transcriptional LysR family regulator